MDDDDRALRVKPPTTNQRIDQRDALDPDGYIPVGHGNINGSIPDSWSLFARVKYASAKKSPRLPGQRPDDLAMAAEMMAEAMERAWRAGYRYDDLMRAASDHIKTL